MNESTRATLVLSGFMGTGKSTVGAKVAALTRTTFVDLDALIVERSCRAIATIFATDGEAGFRELEREALLHALDDAPKVLAVGGGALIDDASRALVLERAFVVTLAAKPETILARTIHDDRPLLNVDNPAATVRRLLKQRASTYDDCHLTLKTDEMNADAVAERLCNRWNGWRDFADP